MPISEYTNFAHKSPVPVSRVETYHSQEIVVFNHGLMRIKRHFGARSVSILPDRQ